MLANPVGIEKPSAAVDGQCANTAKTSTSPASMKMGSDLGRRGALVSDRVLVSSLMGGREFGQMASKIEMYEQLLQEASCLGDASLQARILRALESVSIDFSSSFALSESVEDAGSDEDEVKSGASSSKVSVDQSGSPGGELQPSGRAGSTGSLDRIREDFDRTTTTRATGFHGKSSEVAWMQRLRDQTVEAGGAGSAGLRGRQTGRSPAEEGQRANVPMQTTSGSTYHCDDFNLLALDQIDRFELPRRHIAELLLGDYWETVHPTFPIISKLKFTDQFRQFCDDSAPRLHPKWLAILNVIFAIGAKFSHLVQAEFRGDERDHSIYFARARLLAFDGDGIFAQPDLQLVQVTGLMGFYLMSTNSINRQVDGRLLLDAADAIPGPGPCVVSLCGTAWPWACICGTIAAVCPWPIKRLGTACGGLCTGSNACSGS